jgi:hypothetical protein
MQKLRDYGITHVDDEKIESFLGTKGSLLDSRPSWYPRIESAKLRTAMPYNPGEDGKWHMGLCGEYAMALAEENPNLKIGWSGWEEPDEFGEPGETTQNINHIFAHDDEHAYDIYGKRPLEHLHPGDEYEDPFTTEMKQAFWTTHRSPQELQDEWPIDREMVEEAKQRVRAEGVT